MNKEELLGILKNGMTVGEIITELKKYDENMLVINGSKDYLPISSIVKTNVDYCYDEIITKEVVEIW